MTSRNTAPYLRTWLPHFYGRLSEELNQFLWGHCVDSVSLMQFGRVDFLPTGLIKRINITHLYLF